MAKDIDVKRHTLEGEFGWVLHGFMEANPFVQPEQKAIPPTPEPPDGPFRNPTVVFGYLPTQADLKAPSGYYPYSEGGCLEFKKDGTFTASFRLNIGGSTVPWDTSHPVQGNYKLNGDGTGTLTVMNGETKVLQIFMVLVDPEVEMLLVLTWVTTELGHRRSTGTGYMKRMA